VTAPGFVAREQLEATLDRALCLALPSEREGYGLVVLEAASRGVPTVVVEGPDNAATELIEEGVNGELAPSVAAADLAAAIVRVYEGGDELRRATAAWFARNVRRLSLERSLEMVERIHAGGG
jgi:glycosyltransferase involved in cell wall biosynthesis